jgi:hypothetical protein
VAAQRATSTIPIVFVVVPVPLVNPRKVLPPAELSARIQFDDWTLAYLAL